MNVTEVSPITVGLTAKNKKQYISRIDKQSVKYNQSFGGSINFGNVALGADIVVFTRDIAGDILPKVANVSIVEKLKEFFISEK